MNVRTGRLWALFALILVAGCSTTQNKLVMTSTDRRHDFKQSFSHAFSALNPNGDYDVVLVHDANADSVADTSGVISPAPVSPRQIVHIRVFWLPESGQKLDNPAATNATIQWYIFGDRPDEAASLLKYSGAALVLVNESGTTAGVTIRGAIINLAERRGQMADPLGPSTVSGNLTTSVDRRGVDDILSEIQAADQAGAASSAGN